jgi:hypothetical protein
MPLVGFEPTIPEFERARTVHGLHCDRMVSFTGLRKLIFIAGFSLFYFQTALFWEKSEMIIRNERVR